MTSAVVLYTLANFSRISAFETFGLPGWRTSTTFEENTFEFSIKMNRMIVFFKDLSICTCHSEKMLVHKMGAIQSCLMTEFFN